MTSQSPCGIASFRLLLPRRQHWRRCRGRPWYHGLLLLQPFLLLTILLVEPLHLHHKHHLRVPQPLFLHNHNLLFCGGRRQRWQRRCRLWLLSMLQLWRWQCLVFHHPLLLPRLLQTHQLLCLTRSTLLIHYQYLILLMKRLLYRYFPGHLARSPLEQGGTARWLGATLSGWCSSSMCRLYLLVAVVHGISVLFSLWYDFLGTPSKFDPVSVDFVPLLWAQRLLGQAVPLPKVPP